MHSKVCGTLDRKHLEDCGSEAGNSYGHAHLLFSARSCFLQQDTKYSHIPPHTSIMCHCFMKLNYSLYLSTEKYDLMVKEGEIVCLCRETLSQVYLQILFFSVLHPVSFKKTSEHMMTFDLLPLQHIGTNAIKLHLTTETHPSNGASGWNDSNITLQIKNNVQLIIVRDVLISRRLFKSGVFELASTCVISAAKGWRFCFFSLWLSQKEWKTSYMTSYKKKQTSRLDWTLKLKLLSEQLLIYWMGSHITFVKVFVFFPVRGQVWGYSYQQCSQITMQELINWNFF